MKKSLVFVLVILVFVLGCEEVSDEQVFEELEELSDEELELALEEDEALIGEAGRLRRISLSNPAIVKPERLAQVRKVHNKLSQISWTKCNDTDGGKNYEQRGEVTIEYNNRGLKSTKEENKRKYLDKCENKLNLIEYYCKGNKYGRETVDCELGCGNGACRIQLLCPKGTFKIKNDGNPFCGECLFDNHCLARYGSERGFICNNGTCEEGTEANTGNDDFNTGNGNLTNLVPLSTNNNINKDRVNVVFIPVNIPEEDSEYFEAMVLEYVDLEMPTNDINNVVTCLHGGGPPVYDFESGVLSIEPYKSNPEKFNWWSYNFFYQFNPELLDNYFTTQGKTEYEGIVDSRFIKDIGDIPNLLSVFLVNTNGILKTNHAHLELKEVRMYFNDWNQSKTWHEDCNHASKEETFLHEFQHAFPGLQDEYMYGGNESIGERDWLNFPPNCVKLEDAEAIWGDLVGEGDGLLEIGYFPGCKGYYDLYRPTACSLMRSCPYATLEGISPERFSSERLGLANIRFVQQILDEYSNTIIG